MPMLKCNVARTTWTFRLVRVNYSPMETGVAVGSSSLNKET